MWTMVGAVVVAVLATAVVPGTGMQHVSLLGYLVLMSIGAGAVMGSMTRGQDAAAGGAAAVGGTGGSGGAGAVGSVPLRRQEITFKLTLLKSLGSTRSSPTAVNTTTSSETKSGADTGSGGRRDEQDERDERRRDGGNGDGDSKDESNDNDDPLEGLVRELRDRLNGGSLEPSVLERHGYDANLRRFLIARKGDVRLAEAQILACMEWRRLNHVDTLPEVWTPPEAFKQYRPGGFNGVDKRGNLLYIERAGQLDLNGMLECLGGPADAENM